MSLRPGQLLEVYTAFAVSGHTEHLKEVGACPAVRWLFVHLSLEKGVYPRVCSVLYCLFKTSVPFNLFVCFDIFTWLRWKKGKLQSKIRISNLCSSIEILNCASLCLNQFSTFQQEMACAMKTHRMYTSNRSKTFKLMEAKRGRIMSSCQSRNLIHSHLLHRLLVHSHPLHMSSVHSYLLHRSSAGSMRAPHSTRMPFVCAISWLLLVMMKPPTSCFWRCRNPCGWKLTRRPLGDSSCVLWPGMRGSVEAQCCPDDTGYNHLCGRAGSWMERYFHFYGMGK